MKRTKLTAEGKTSQNALKIQKQCSKKYDFLYMNISKKNWKNYKFLANFKLYSLDAQLKGPIVYIIKGRSLKRHKQSFSI